MFLAWILSALVDHRVRFRRTPFERPFRVFAAVALLSLLANVGHAASVSSYVLKQLLFFAGVVLLAYFVTSVFAGRVDRVVVAVKAIVYAGVVLSLFAILEARTGYNVFLHLERVIPILQQGNIYEVNAATDSRGAGNRAFGASQHPIEFGALLAMIVPLALALAGATRQRRWLIAAALIMPAMFGALSRTIVPMLIGAILAALWTRKREVTRLWPALIPLVVVIHFAVPGALGSLTKSFFPEGGLIADQKTGDVGSGRISTLGPALRSELYPNPAFGVGFSTRVTTTQDPSVDANAPILDNQWLGVLLETGIVGFVALIWLFVTILRRCGRAAKIDYGLRGWILAGITSSLAAYMLGMFTFDAFAFVQVTLVFTTLVGLAAALLIDAHDTTERRSAADRARPASRARRPAAALGESRV